MIKVYKYTRHWKNWHIHAPSKEDIAYIPVLKVCLYFGAGSTFSSGSIGVTTEEKYITEGEAVVNGTETDIDKIVIIEMKEDQILMLLDQIKQRDILQKEIEGSFNLIKETMPKLVRVIKLDFEVKYSCGDHDDCYYRTTEVSNKRLLIYKHRNRGKFEHQVYMLSENTNLKKVLETNFDTKITTGVCCEVDNKTIRPNHILTCIKKEIIENYPYTKDLEPLEVFLSEMKQ